MAMERKVREVVASKSTMEGAGVRLWRAFGFNEAPSLDPFLLLDDFRATEPRHYIKGFPWHPHRGIETITYILEGTVEHGDSLGNSGTIGPGDLQWMTAGSGIIHQEMPKGDPRGRMGGFQLWANLPAAEKMRDPRYRDVKASQVPEIDAGTGVRVRIVAGEIGGTRGPIRDVVTDPEYLDVTVAPGTEFVHATTPGHRVFAYVIEGSIRFGAREGQAAENATLVLFEDGERLTGFTRDDPARFLLVSGRPIGEPVAWYGPIVMNTEEELRVAFDEYRNGTFLKKRTSFQG